MYLETHDISKVANGYILTISKPRKEDQEGNLVRDTTLEENKFTFVFNDEKKLAEFLKTL
jgi:hypothetical protein